MWEIQTHRWLPHKLSICSPQVSTYLWLPHKLTICSLDPSKFLRSFHIFLMSIRVKNSLSEPLWQLLWSQFEEITLKKLKSPRATIWSCQIIIFKSVDLQTGGEGLGSQSHLMIVTCEKPPSHYLLYHHLWTPANEVPFTGVKISPGTITVYTVDDHTVSCVISGITSQISGVVWSTATNLVLNPNDGTLDTQSGSQTSTVTLTR